MDVNIKNKRGIAFSFAVFFIAIIVFALIEFNMNINEFEKEDVFINSRIGYLNDELNYFKSTYIQNSAKYSFYNTINGLMISLKHNPWSVPIIDVKDLNKNYSKLNELIYEGLTNGSFNGINQPLLENKTLNYFLNKYKTSFEKNNYAKLNFNITQINVYETKPYYLSLQLLVNWSVTTNDNISTWNTTEDNFFIDIPIENLPVPDFIYNKGLIIPSKSVEYNLPDKNWTLNNFIKVINESYSSVFIEEKHKYTIGKSYLKRILNITNGSYTDVIGSFNFDYDIEEKEVYDSSLHNNFSKRYGNSIALYDMLNSSITINNLPDNSDYNHTLKLNGGMNCNELGISNTACIFDGTNDYLVNNNFKPIYNNISVFAWINISNTSSNIQHKIVCANNNYFCYWYDDNEKSISITFNKASKIVGGSDRIIFNNINISKNKWHNVGFTYDGNKTYLYINALKYESKEINANSNNYYGNLNASYGNLFVGKDGNSNTGYFEGEIDEIGIYNKILTQKEIGELFNKKKIFDVDYVDSLYKKGRYFDGIDDYIDMGNSNVYNFFNRRIAVEFWLKMNNISGKQILIDKGESGLNGPGDGWGIMIKDGKIGVENRIVRPEALTNIPVINKTNYYYHIVINAFDRGDIDIYVNNKKYIIPASLEIVKNEAYLTTRNLTIGRFSTEDNCYFNGVIDEIRIYNRSLTDQEVENNYHNYQSFGRGCCNYMLLINPNKLGYNTTSYKNNISYTTKLFYDYNVNNIHNNISLYSLTNVTSSDIDKNFYNFLLDDCMVHAYSVSDYQIEDDSIELDVHKTDGLDNAKCSNLVKLGIY